MPEKLKSRLWRNADKRMVSNESSSLMLVSQSRKLSARAFQPAVSNPIPARFPRRHAIQQSKERLVGGRYIYQSPEVDSFAATRSPVEIFVLAQ